MGALRSALFLDFDNVFSGLLKLDPAVALDFAQAPLVWLDRLASSDARARRWLVLRCYMNPAGSVPDPRAEGARVPFFRFRSAFTDAGFEVIDCPRLSHTKNGADIRLVIDAVDALQADARYDEFVIASGDSDMTPLLVRLRSADRAVTLVSPSDSAVVMRSVAERLIDGDDLLELLDASRDAMADAMDVVDEPGAGIPTAVDPDADPAAEQRFSALVVNLYDAAKEPILLSALAHSVLTDVGPVAKASGWFGHQTFGRALRALDLPGARFSALHMWDSKRHTPPDIKEAVVRVATALKIPTLPPESWRSISEALAAFAAHHEFNLTEATRWARDRVGERGHRVNRPAVGLVARGAAFGGAALYSEPPPTAEAVARAFVDNLLERAAAADIELTASEAEDVREWFGAAEADRSPAAPFMTGRES